MPKNWLLALLAVLFVIVAYRLYLIIFPKSATQLPARTILIKDIPYTVEIASTDSQKSLGLGNRKNLCPNCGMLFVFNSAGSLPFWMKDTLIPLDMIWLNSSGQIVTIQTAQPQPGVPIYKLKIYQNTLPAQYVLELNAGDVQKLGLKTGDFINL